MDVNKGGFVEFNLPKPKKVKKVTSAASSVDSSGISIKNFAEHLRRESKDVIPDLPPAPKTKPWEKSQNEKKRHKMRIPLPRITAYEKELKFPVVASQRILIRLERLMGTDEARITDHRYLQTLSRRIDEDEKEGWEKRSNLRKKKELNRFRKLIIDGVLAPEPGTEEFFEVHPMYRVNKAMKRISNLKTYTNIPALERKPPSITPVEPFDEYEKTGFLFGSHKNHYLRTKSLHRNFSRVKPTPSTASSSLSELKLSNKVSSSRGVGDMERSYYEEWGGEEDELDYKFINENKEEEEEFSTLLKRGEVERAKVKLNLTDDLEEKWGRRESSIIKTLFNTDMEESKNLIPYASKVAGLYKRENLKMDDFISTKHRKAFVKEMTQTKTNPS